MLVKGIKKGKTIELLEEVDFPDNKELLVEIREINDFWSALEDFGIVRSEYERCNAVLTSKGFQHLTGFDSSCHLTTPKGVVLF